MVLTSSFDWSVKLWNPKLKNEPLCTFESAEDYVYDVCWNRANPCLFTSVDGEGYIDLWNLSQDLEMPIIHQKAGKIFLETCFNLRFAEKLTFYR